MPIIKEMSAGEKIALMYYGQSKSQVLGRTHYKSEPSMLRVSRAAESFLKTHPARESKFRSNSHLFNLKFNSSLPKSPLKLEDLYISRKSQTEPFSPKKISRSDLEKILKWGLFYNSQEKRFTVPCGGALYHYEIYLCLFQSYLLPLGLYRYNPQSFSLGLIKTGNFIKEAGRAMGCYLDRLNSSSGIMFLVSDLSESKRKYDFLSERLILLDIGHLMQSMNLALALAGFGLSNIGGGKDREILKFLGEKRSNYIAAIYFGGRPKK